MHCHHTESVILRLFLSQKTCYLAPFLSPFFSIANFFAQFTFHFLFPLSTIFHENFRIKCCDNHNCVPYFEISFGLINLFASLGMYIFEFWLNYVKIRRDSVARKSFCWKMVFCYQKWENLLKFEAEGRDFAKFLRSLEQFIQTVKGQNNFW